MRENPGKSWIMLILTSTFEGDSSISSYLKMPMLSSSEVMLFQPPRGFMFNAEEKKKISLITAFLFKPSIGYQWLPEDTKFSRT